MSFISNSDLKAVFKSVLPYAGTCLAVLGIAFVAIRLFEYRPQINFEQFEFEVYLVLFLAIIGYGAAGTLLAFAWQKLLTHLGTPVSRTWAVQTYGISQIAKYAPGNIFHLAGRQAIGLDAGIAGMTLAKSTILELGLLVCCGSLLGILALPQITPSISAASGMTLFGLGVTAFFAAIRSKLGLSFATAAIYYLFFLSVSGLLFCTIVATLSEPTSFPWQKWITLLGSYILAWLIGFATPGAPAGLGVREAVLLILIPPTFLASNDLLMSVVLGRVVTTSGDIIFFCGALGLRKYINHK